ncbi:MAG: hypothetical protein RRY72_05875, partial [Bacteroides sp.]
QKLYSHAPETLFSRRRYIIFKAYYKVFLGKKHFVIRLETKEDSCCLAFAPNKEEQEERTVTVI